MSGKLTDFRKLSEDVISELKKMGYKESSLTNYRRFYARIETFMSERSMENYSQDIGKEFLNEYYPDDSSRRKVIFMMIRRIDDYLNSIPYRCHNAVKTSDVPADFRGVLEDYLTYCANMGNKPGTIAIKKDFCLIFLQYLAQNEQNDISFLTVETVVKGCLNYKNKDGYAELRKFLRYLFENNIIKQDYSMIVPRYKRHQVVPSVYTPDEIKCAETTIDKSGNTGKRNLAIFLLVTRMGLRSGDIAALKLSEIDFQTNHINLIQEKTGKPLTIFMPSEVSSALKEHIEYNKLSLLDNYVFHGMKAPYKRLTTSIIRHTIHNSLASANIDIHGRKHGPHALRSSLASSLIYDGASYDTVRKILGHSDPDAIKHYVKTDIERLRKCALNPPDPSGKFLDILSGRGQ